MIGTWGTKLKILGFPGMVFQLAFYSNLCLSESCKTALYCFYGRLMIGVNLKTCLDDVLGPNSLYLLLYYMPLLVFANPIKDETQA